MSGQWKEVARLCFKGTRFQDHALDLSAVGELAHFQRIVAETAKALWHSAHPERERLPKQFEQRTRLCVRKIEEGSAVVPLEVYIEQPKQPEFFEPEPVEVKEAIGLAHRVFRAAERDEPLPDGFPRSLLPEYARWGQDLGEDEEVQIVPPGEEAARVTRVCRSRLLALTESSHEDRVDITGEVLEADVRQGRFQVWLNDRTGVTIAFQPDQEETITSALRDHHTVRLRVVGRGEFSAQGRLLRVARAEKIALASCGELPYDLSARPIEEVLEELARAVPDEEWDKLPPDLTDNIDHYVYGTPKR